MICRLLRNLLKSRTETPGREAPPAPSGPKLDAPEASLRPEYFYRFRSVDALIGERAELEKQEIYFSELSQLNDPMEGSRDVFWCGDVTLWTNLMKHYLLSLELLIVQASMLGPDFKPDLSRLVFATTMSLPTQMFRDVHKEICDDFFTNPDVALMPKLLTERRDSIRRDELLFYLKGLQTEAFLCVVTVLQKHNLFPEKEKPRADETNSTLHIAINFLKSLNENPSDQRHTDLAEKLFRLTFQLAHRTAITIRRDKHIEDNIWWNSLISSFPEKYVAALDHLTSADYYVACFVDDPHQAAMWGNYGDSHKGICLKFRSSANSIGEPTLSLKGIVGWNGGKGTISPIRNFVSHPFRSVLYQDKFPQVDFFRSLGRIPTPALNRDWFSDGNGSFSPVMREIHDNEEQWRKEYWSRFEKIARTKLTDWQHEREYRIILYSMLDGFRDPLDRKLFYNFEDLAGIIFGINTAIDDRVKIIEIVEQKCKAVGRSDFEFLQAHYSAKSGKIETYSLLMNEAELRRPIGQL